MLLIANNKRSFIFFIMNEISLVRLKICFRYYIFMINKSFSGQIKLFNKSKSLSLIIHDLFLSLHVTVGHLDLFLPVSKIALVNQDIM